MTVIKGMESMFGMYCFLRMIELLKFLIIIAIDINELFVLVEIIAAFHNFNDLSCL